MTMIRGKGQLAHHFHSPYWASLAIGFGNEAEAREALRVLGEPWKLGTKHPEAIVCSVDRAALEAVKQQLGQLGADVSAIDSVRKSVDYGDPFTIDVPVLPPAEPRPEGWRESFSDESGSMTQRNLWEGCSALGCWETAVAGGYCKKHARADAGRRGRR